MTLQEFFGAHPKAALAFSGGVDSSYLLYAARQLGADVKAYYVKTAFQPEFEYQDALRLASQLGADIQVLTLDVLACPDVTVNPKNRCYFCKQHIFGNILRQAKADGYDTVLDGTNASDQVSDRPGMKALQEMKVLSPLRLTGLTKAENPGTVPCGGALHLGQALLCLPGYPDPHGDGDHRSGFGPDRMGRGSPDEPGLPGSAGAPAERRPCPGPAA